MARRDLIEDLIAGRWREGATGRPVRVGTRAIVIERSLDGGEPELIAPLALGERLAVISDRNTYDALGDRVARALARISRIDEVVLDAPVADLATVDELRARTGSAAALVAVGSGTLNDVCKLLAHRSEIKRLMTKARDKGYTLVPLEIYLRDGKIKVEVALARGKKHYEKRESEREKEARKEMEE